MSDGFFIAEFVAPLLNFMQNAFGGHNEKTRSRSSELYLLHGAVDET